jgi:hypothetical protein
MYRLTEIVRSRYRFSSALYFDMIPPMLPTVYAKIPHARIIDAITYSFSLLVFGTISPYPTVVMVVNDQYSAVM